MGVNMELKLRFMKDISVTSGFTVQSSRYNVVQQFNSKEFFRTPSDYGYMNLDWDFAPRFSFSSALTYTGKMIIPYFGPLASDPESGELHKSYPFLDIGCKLSYDIRLNGSSLRVFTGIKNIFNSYQSDFDMGIDRDPSYIYGPVSPRMLYFGFKVGNMLK